MAAIVVMLFLVLGVVVGRTLLGGRTATFRPSAEERAVLVYLNQARKANGLSSFTYDATLAKYARAHTADMIASNYFEHDKPGGPTYAQRVQALFNGIRHVLEENIAYGSGSYGTAKALVASWMASPGHRANILNPAVHKTGQGILTANNYQGIPTVVVATSEFSN